ncbi:CitMHS family transporter [Brevibacterium sp. UCMA 11752]|uniref:CitMHS family transporter n=1 Tax=Brevibacterium sp. UCMA 11752 TaxID=2745946 RepID=UPI001F2480C1|nr:SLC13 family permease [Brevibacterium sp. UCMA 11752]MCF2585994.1 citrate transporter [Brevibacterium sp. UCMA 11752]
MLSLIGYVSMLVILALLLWQKVSPIVALAGVPIVAALIAGNSPSKVSEFALAGITSVASVVVMFIFAIVFFGILRHVGFFDPVIDRIIRLGGSSPKAVAVATTLLASVAHLDGAGATTFLITIPAMLPIYQRLGMSRLTLTACVGLGAGAMNMLPWGGPTARAAATVGVEANEVWTPLIPAQIVGVIAALGVAWFLGSREAKRIAKGKPSEFAEPVHAHDANQTTRSSGADTGARTTSVMVDTGAHGTAVDGTDSTAATDDSPEKDHRNIPLWVNGLILLATLVVLMWGIVSPAIAFLVATILALIINFRGLENQSRQFDISAKSAMLMASTLLAAGVLLGVLDESGMIESMADSAVQVLPAGIMPILPIVVAVLGVPMSLFFGPDAYYFGVLPVLSAVGSNYGIDPVLLAQASIIGQETLGFPISPLTGSFYLLVGLANVPIGKHILGLIGWAWLVSIIVLIAAIVIGVIPLWVA